MVERNYSFDGDDQIYEDELPEDMTDDDYSDWYGRSWVDGVRLGPMPVRLAPHPTGEPG